MSEPIIAIMRDEVYADDRRIGRISTEGTVRRFWYWPNGDEVNERPASNDIAAILNDERKTVAAIRSALATQAD